MLLNANLLVYKDALYTYVYCPEIDFAENGELLRDAEYSFYRLYPQYLDSFARHSTLLNFLGEHKWRNTENGLFCPIYNFDGALNALVEKRLGSRKDNFHFTGQLLEIVIAIPLYGKTDDSPLPNRFISKE
jgi:hypothetical protein